MLSLFSPSRRKCDAGVALIVVLWVLVILTIMAGSFSLNLRRETELVRNAKARAETTALAEAGIYYAMMMLLLEDPESRWRSDGSIYEFSMARARVRVQIYDEAGKIDLNNASPEMLEGGLMQAGADIEQARAITDAILDWRDQDSIKRPEGAETEDYKAAGYAYGPRNKPFQTVEELQLVMGMSVKLYQNLESLLTVYSRQKGLDPAKAPRTVLLAIPGATEELVDQYLAERTESQQANVPLPEFPIPLGAAGSGGERAYAVLAEVSLEEGGRGRLLAVIERAGARGAKPFNIVTWNQPVKGENSLF